MGALYSTLFYIQNLFLITSSTITLVQVITSVNLDYCYSILTGLPVSASCPTQLCPRSAPNPPMACYLRVKVKITKVTYKDYVIETCTFLHKTLYPHLMTSLSLLLIALPLAHSFPGLLVFLLDLEYSRTWHLQFSVACNDLPPDH